MIIKILGGLFFIVLCFQFFFSIATGNIEKSNYTDWMSAFCNVVMAGAALGGYLIAKDWKRHSVKEKVLNLALEMKTTYASQMYEGLSDLNMCFHKIQNLSYINANKNSDFTNFNNSLEGLLKVLTVHNNKLKENVHAFCHNYSQIQSLGYDFKSELSYSLNNIIVNIIEANTCSNIIIMHLTDLLENPLQNLHSSGSNSKDNLTLLKEIIASESVKFFPRIIGDGIERLYEYHISMNGSVFNDLKYIG